MKLGADRGGTELCLLLKTLDWPHIVPVPAPESHCGVFTLLHVRSELEVLAMLFPGSMISDGGYSVVEVQLAKLILSFSI